MNPLISECALTLDSSFEDIAQAAIAFYYLPPYQNANDTKPHKVNRVYHGGVHVSRCALAVDLLVELYQKYAPEMVIKPDGKPLSDPLTADDLKFIKLLKLALIYHDSANISEVKGDPNDHAINFYNDMLLLGYKEEEIMPFATAMIEKDSPLADKSFWGKIIQSSDCLDIIRVAKGSFDRKRLDIYQDLHAKPGFEQELEQIIINHFETIELIEGEGKGTHPLHKECEFSSNCYKSTASAMLDMFLSHVIIEATKQGKGIDLSKLDLSKIKARDLFNRKNSPLVQKIIDTCGTSNAESTTKTDPVIENYKQEGILVRALQSSQIDNELKTLDQNAKSLKTAGIATPEQMRNYLFMQQQNAKVFTPPDFKWRPCSYIKAGIPIQLFTSGIGVLIDPHLESGTIVSHFYKKNVISATAATGSFEYSPQTSGRKDRTNLGILREKILEEERRRIGAEVDTNAHYYGHDNLPHSEILGTYQPNSVLGILISLDPQSVKDALILQAKLGTPLKPFYHYSPRGELTSISKEELIKRLELSELEILVETLNDKLKLANGITLREKSPNSDGKVAVTNDGDFELDYKTYEIVISEAVPPHIRALINLHFSKIKMTPPPKILNASEPFSFENEDSQGNSVNRFSFLHEDEKTKKDHYRGLIQILMGLNEKLEESVSFEDVEKEIILIAQLNENAASLKINQTPSDLHISADNPLKYTFKHPVDSSVTCHAFVKRGIPVIELRYANGKVSTHKTDQLPKLANLFFQQATERLQSALQDPEVVAALNKLGACNIRIRNTSVDFKKEKSSLALSFDTTDPSLNKAEVMAKLLQAMGVTMPEKVKLLSYDFQTKPNNQNEYGIPQMQQIDHFVKHLREYAAPKHHSTAIVAEYSLSRLPHSPSSKAPQEEEPQPTPIRKPSVS